MRIVDYHHRNLVYRLIVVYPRIEQRIDEGHDDKEDEYALIAHHLFHLLSPDIGGIAYSLI